MSARNQRQLPTRRPANGGAFVPTLLWGRLRGGVAANRAPIRFLVVFSGAILGYFLLTVSLSTRDPAGLRDRPVVSAIAAVGEWTRNRVLVPYHCAIAQATAEVLSAFGEPATASGREIRSERFSVLVTHGCDGIELSLMFGAAVISFPAALRRKVAGMLLGLILIALLNLIRVVSLWLIGVHWFTGFDLMHFGLWPVILIGATLGIFLAWLQWAAADTKPGAVQSSGPSH